MRTLHVFITEDQQRLAQMLRDHLELDPGFQVVGVAVNGQDMLKQIANGITLPDIVLMDIQMPVVDGIKATEALKALHPQIKVVMATIFDDEENIFNAILAGADGYLLKDEAPEVLHRALREVMSGGAPMSPAIARKSLAMLRRNPAPTLHTPTANELSEREREILEHLSKGLRYDQVADNLNISSGTVRKHIENIYRKLQVHNKLSAVEAGKKLGLI